MARAHGDGGDGARVRARLRQLSVVIVVCAAILCQPTLLTADERGVQYTVVTSSRGEIEVIWDALAKDAGHFELLRGSDLLSMQVIAVQPARAGNQRYSHTDRHRIGDGCIYQLRYVDHMGREIYLGTVFCRESGAGPKPVLPLVQYDAMDLTPGVPELVAEQVDSARSDARTRDLPWNLIPPVPPPECSRQV